MEKVNVSNKIKKKKNFYTHQLPTVLPPHNYKNKKGKKKNKKKNHFKCSHVGENSKISLLLSLSR